MKSINYPFLILIFTLVACNDPTPLSEIDTVEAGEKNVFSRTTTFERDQTKRDATESDRNKIDFDRYVYDWDVDEASFIERMPRVNVNAINTDSTFVNKISYQASTDNRPPVFKQECLQEDDPLLCSTSAINSIVEKIIEESKTELTLNRDFDLVTFIIDEKGKILGDIFIAPQNELCEDCNKVSIKAITQMGEWLPAIKDGVPTPVRIQIPIRY